MKNTLKYTFLYLALFLSPALLDAQNCNSPTSTPYATNNGQDGIMFTITAKRNIVIDSFANNHGAGNIPEYRIYYKCGTATGAMTTPAAWTLVGQAYNVVSAGQNNATMIPINVNIPISEYQTVAFYLTTTGTGPICRYTNGGNVCDSLGGNNDLVLHEGYGKDYPFGATFTTREFNGTVYYSCTGNTQPAINGNFAFCNATIGQQETYTLNPPSPPGCGAANVAWLLPSGMTPVGAANNDTITVQFTSTNITGQICAALFGCDGNDTIYKVCEPIVSQPDSADAGPDETICSSEYTLQGNSGTGFWEVLGGSGVLANPAQYNTTVSGLSIGVNTFRWNVGGGGCPWTSDEVNITVNPLPVAQFNPINGCDGEAIPFQDSSYALAGNIIGWSWDVDGDANIDYTTSTFNHIYPGPGTYQATLVVTANQGCNDTVTHSIVVHPNPQVNFSYTPECEGSPMAFADMTTLLSGNLDTWKWEFGDGTAPSQAQNPSHVYVNDSVYNVTLTVTSDKGCEVSFMDSVEVFSIPDVDFFAEEECRNDTVVFLDTSTSTQGVINYWDWDFGDGSPTVNTQDTEHYYFAHGTYFVRLTVATDKGCTNTVVKSHRAFPIPEPDYSQEGVCEAQEVFFTSQATVDPIYGTTLVKWDWGFGDGDSASNKTVGHYYQDPGYYDLGLTPMTNFGCTNTVEFEVLIRPKPRANAIVLDDEVCAETPINYRDKSFFDPTYDTLGIVNWNWDFGDGQNAIIKDPKHTFAVGGVYQTVMTVSTTYGCIDSSTIETVVYHNPRASFRFDTLEGCSPHCVTFIDQSKLATGEELTYNWSFGDGESNLADVNPTHCYAVESGTGITRFPVRVEITSPNGCIDTFKLEDDVIVHSRPIADFELSNTKLSFLEPVVYIDDYSIGADYWLWDFGDSITSTMSNPIEHVYKQPGIFTIDLTVNDEFGCLDSHSVRLLVERHQSIYIPKSFTPNDDDLNDYFAIQGEDFEYLKMWIFDRWGNQVFYGEDEDAKWDGTDDGEPMPIGSYAYVIEYRMVNQIKQNQSGNVILSKTNN